MRWFKRKRTEAPPAVQPQTAETALEASVRRARRTLALERALRLGAALATLGLLFLALSWSGLWLVSGVWGRIFGLALFGFLALLVVAREIARGWPGRRVALARIDAATPGLRPASSLDDRLAGAEPGSETAALWRAHRARLERALRRTPLAPPDPRLPERDPYALRALALVAAVAAGFAAGGEKSARLAAAFDWRAAGPDSGAARVDAWLDPPAYTGRPSIVLPATGTEAPAPIAAPVNSVLHVRASGGSVAFEGGLAPIDLAPPDNKDKARLVAGERALAFALTGAARLGLPDGRNVALTAIPDEPPSIAMAAPPRNNTRGSMTLAYRAEDDYGVVEVEATIAREGGARALVPPPKLLLSPSPGRDADEEKRATVDLSDSPWAGAKARLTLVARDAAGNEGRSETVDLVLPHRRFTKPLARALVEQRRELALDPDSRVRVHTALEALALAPETFDTPAGVHLGLRAALRSLEGPRSESDLRGVVELLWSMALDLEEGDLSQAERDLRAAQNALREALARGADESEIARLTKDLRAALDKFLQGLGEQAARNQKRGDAAPSDDASQRTLSEEDLQAMLDEMARAMQSGDLAEAQRLLDQLQDILENAQAAQGGSGGRKKQMSRALSELDRLAREQQQLRDETFRGMNPEEAPSSDGQGEGEGAGLPGEGGARGGVKRQRDLRGRLERQQDALRGADAEAGEELEAARKAMKEAERSLGGAGDRGEAVEAQGEALEALRRGADRLASKMRGAGEEGGEEAEGEGEGDGQGRRAGRSRGGGAGEDRDPLGRESGARRGVDWLGRYDPLGLPPALRAHRLQEELRRRLGQPERPAQELDYLERLLRR
jgi:uncharacterized protein (TIGR02302 family)